MSTTTSRCESCDQNIYTEHCDACSTVIPNGDQLREYIHWMGSREGHNWELRIELCASCRGGLIGMDALVDRILKKMKEQKN